MWNTDVRRPQHVAKYRCGNCGVITKVQNEIHKDDRLQCVVCNRWLTRMDRIMQINEPLR